MTLKPLIAAVALSALAASAAQAADLDIPELRDWTGVYVGANGGYSFGAHHQWDYRDENEGGYSGDHDMDGFSAGGQIGFNWQLTEVVLGVESDIQWSAVEGTFGSNNGWFCDNLGCSTNIGWFGTTRARAGYLFGDMMAYATGGLAYANFQSELEGGGGDWQIDETALGWTAGGGLEMGFGDGFSAKIEYLYIDLERQNAQGSYYEFEADANFSVVRAGLNYGF